MKDILLYGGLLDDYLSRSIHNDDSQIYSFMLMNTYSQVVIDKIVHDRFKKSSSESFEEYLSADFIKDHDARLKKFYYTFPNLKNIYSCMSVGFIKDNSEESLFEKKVDTILEYIKFTF